mmetsp:Transcript_16125/g.49279  ORF Transcript_16125/g.49279 Transcript_16125/m.49279 type:complete len:243 (-) Transcript_16125:327-1055(-)
MLERKPPPPLASGSAGAAAEDAPLGAAKGSSNCESRGAFVYMSVLKPEPASAGVSAVSAAPLWPPKPPSMSEMDWPPNWMGGASVSGDVGSSGPASTAGAGAMYREMMSPNPSMMASSTPPTAALRAAAMGPARSASTPPVAAPERMLFHGSSFCRYHASVQSKLAKMPPQTAKLPPMMGERMRIAFALPASACPRGLFRKPFTPCHTVPPTAPMANAPPTSSRMRHGHGSLPESCCRCDMI